MEDAHAVDLNLDSQSDDTQSNTFFAVYDGHGGTHSNYHCTLLGDLRLSPQVLQLRNTLVNTSTSGSSKAMRIERDDTKRLSSVPSSTPTPR